MTSGPSPHAGAVFVALPDIKRHAAVMSALQTSFSAVHMASHRDRAMAEVKALGPEITAVIVGVKEQVDASVLDALPNLRAVASAGTGTDHLDLTALTERGVSVSTTPGLNAVSVAEHAMAMILALAKRTLSGHAAALAGRDRLGMPEPPVQIRGRRAGVLGAGSTARCLIPLLQSFGADIAVWTRRPEQHDDLPVMGLKELFQRSDIVSIHLPLADGTRGLVNAELLRLLPHGALVVNTARKEIVDPGSLRAVLAERPDLRFAVDAFGLQADGTAALVGGAGLLSPHIAGATVEALNAMYESAARQAIRAASAEPS